MLISDSFDTLSGDYPLRQSFNKLCGFTEHCFDTRKRKWGCRKPL